MEAPTTAQAWHALFATASLPALAAALEAGLVPVPCVWEERDLLHTLLARPPSLFGATQAWWGAQASAGMTPLSPAPPGDLPRLADVSRPWCYHADYRPAVRQVVGLVEALLARPDVDPLVAHPATELLGPVYDPQASTAQVRASAWDLALAANLVPVAEQVAHWACTRGRGETLRTGLDAASGAGLAAPAAQWPPLHASAATQRQVMAQALLDMGADPNTQDAAGRGPLYHAKSPAMAKLLLESGADPRTSAVGQDVYEHWVMQRKQSRNRKDTWDQMLSLLSSHAPAMASGARQLAAVAWFGSAAAQPGKNYDNAAKLRTGWEAGWNANVVPALGQGEASALRGRVNSGPVRGAASLLSELGWRWLRGKDGGSACHLALMSHAVDPLGPAPMAIRRGLEDWDVFVLGSGRHWAERAQRITWTNPASRGLLDHSLARTQDLLDRMGPPDQRLVRAQRAAAMLARAHNPSLWGNTAQAWTGCLGQAFAGLNAGSILSALSQEEMDRCLAACRAGAQAGVRWVADWRILKNAWNASRKGALLSGQAREDLLVTCLCAMADHQAMDPDRFRLADDLQAEFGEMVAALAGDLRDPTLLACATAGPKLRAAALLVAPWCPALATRLAGQALEHDLPQATQADRPRPRM